MRWRGLHSGHGGNVAEGLEFPNIIEPTWGPRGRSRNVPPACLYCSPSAQNGGLLLYHGSHQKVLHAISDKFDKEVKRPPCEIIDCCTPSLPLVGIYLYSSFYSYALFTLPSSLIDNTTRTSSYPPSFYCRRLCYRNLRFAAYSLFRFFHLIRLADH